MNANATTNITDYRVVHHERVRQIDEAEKLAARHRLDPVLAVGERRLQVEEIDHLRQRERDHREVDALAADREQACHNTERGCSERPCQDRKLGRPSPFLRGVRAHVSRSAEEHRVPEGQEPAEAYEQIERARKKREAQRFHHEHGIHAHEGRDGEQRRHDGGGPEKRRARGHGSGNAGLDRGGCHQRSLPKESRGFHEQHDDHDHEDHRVGSLGIEHLGEPLDHAEAEARQDRAMIEPMPPMTTTANTTMMRLAPICGLTW
jgi:hypothetical protein